MGCDRLGEQYFVFRGLMARYIPKPYDPYRREGERPGRPRNTIRNLPTRLQRFLVKHAECCGREGGDVHSIELKYADVRELVNDYVDIRRVKRNVERELAQTLDTESEEK